MSEISLKMSVEQKKQNDIGKWLKKEQLYAQKNHTDHLLSLVKYYCKCIKALL